MRQWCSLCDQTARSSVRGFVKSSVCCYYRLAFLEGLPLILAGVPLVLVMVSRPVLEAGPVLEARNGRACSAVLLLLPSGS